MSDRVLAANASFAGRTVLVTGGGGYIGRSMSLAFARAGANVVVNDFPSKGEAQDRGPAERVAKEIQEAGGNSLAVTESVVEGDKIIAQVIQRFKRIDIIVNAAGIQQTKPVEEETIQDFRRIMEVNAIGTASTIVAAWPHFQKQRYGRVINVISDTIFGQGRLTSYIFSKGAVFAGTRALAAEGASHGILVNCVAPVASSPMALKHLEGVGLADRERQTKWLVDKFPAESNVPMILALAHESNTLTGEAFSVGAWSVSRIVLGFQDGVTKAFTMEDCLQRRSEILGEKEVKIPKDCPDLGNLSPRGKD